MTIHRIDDIFSEEERLKIIEDVQPLLIDGAEMAQYHTAINKPDYGLGYQEGFLWFDITHATLNEHPDFKDRIKFITQKASEEVKDKLKCVSAWINVSDGRKERKQYHTHEGYDFSSVYYIKTFPFFSNGTLFKDKGLIKSPQNSIIIFPSHLPHTTPSSPLRFKRYTMALDFVKEGN